MRSDADAGGELDRGCEDDDAGARKPVEPGQSPEGTMMSFNGPAEAWARGMSPAA